MSKKVIIALITVAILILVFIKINSNKDNDTNMNANNNTNIDNCNHIETKNNSQNGWGEPIQVPWETTDKPIIYIYPTKSINVSIILGNPQYISHSYPKYTNGWNVTANPDGTLIDNYTGRKLYALYWEGRDFAKDKSMNEGFCIKGEDTIKFLEEKLVILGLNEREAEEFIIYWLPKMENNKYNYIRFETIEEQNMVMPLDINPKPDTVIRIMMDWKGLENKIEVKEQILTPAKREGYTVVEWGGSELK